MKKLRHVIEGEGWVPVTRAATLLGTSSARIREMMGDGRLDWRQPRVNSRNFVVSERDLQRLRLERVDAKYR